MTQGAREEGPEIVLELKLKLLVILCTCSHFSIRVQAHRDFRVRFMCEISDTFYTAVKDMNADCSFWL